MQSVLSDDWIMDNKHKYTLHIQLLRLCLSFIWRVFIKMENAWEQTVFFVIVIAAVVRVVLLCFVILFDRFLARL